MAVRFFCFGFEKRAFPTLDLVEIRTSMTEFSLLTILGCIDCDLEVSISDDV